MRVRNIQKQPRTLLATATSIAILEVLLASQSAVAQTAPAPAPSASSAESAPPDNTQTITIVGQRGVPRSQADSPTPVDLISGDDLKRGGHANLYQDLQLQVPSFNQPAKAGSGTSSAVITGALRGLNPDQTLVLVNGIRWHHTALLNVGNQLYNGSAPVDLGMIPTSGLDSVQVLREGAAAQYGSDAIAGVVNLVLKAHPGGSISGQYGENFDRHDGQLAIVKGDYGLHFGDSGSLNVFFSAQEQKQSDRSYPVASTIQLFPKLADGSPDPREATVNRQISRGFGAFPYGEVQLGYNARDSIGDIELYSFGTFSHRNQSIVYPPIIPNQAAALPEVFPNFAWPTFKIDENDGQVAAGARSTFSDWDWDASVTGGEDSAPESLSQSLNASLGPTTPTSFNLGSLTSREFVSSLDVTRKFALDNRASLQVSWGLQDRVEQFKIGAGDLASYELGTYVEPAGQPFAGVPQAGGAIFAPGYRPADAGGWDRNIAAAYGELGYEPTREWFLGVAGRVEHFSDSAGTSFVGKVDTRYKVNDWFNLRGSIGNGFHAPSLAQEHYSSARVTPSTAAATLGQVITNQILPVDNPAAIALGAKPLKPEKSVDTSLGFSLNPTKEFTLTVDGYMVNVNHRIVLGSVLQGPAVNAILVANGLSPNLTGQYFSNAVNTRTTGADIISTYLAKMGGYGDLHLSAAINVNHTRITKINPNPSQLDALGSSYVQFDRPSQGFLTSAIPTSKVALGGTWNIRSFELGLQEIRYGKFEVPGANASLDRFFPAKWITNLTATYHITDHVSFTAGADNIFNVYPPANNIPLAQYGYGQYPRISPFGFTGGSWFTRLQADF